MVMIMMMKCLLYAKYKAAIENYRSFKGSQSGGDTGIKYKLKCFLCRREGWWVSTAGWVHCTLAPVLVQGCHRHHSSLIINVMIIIIMITITIIMITITIIMITMTVTITIIMITITIIMIVITVTITIS